MTSRFGTVCGVTSKRTSTTPDGTSGARGSRRSRGIWIGLLLGLVLSLASVATPIPWAIKVALVSTALLGIAGYATVHVVHLYDTVDEDELAERSVIQQPGTQPASAPADDKDRPQ